MRRYTVGYISKTDSKAVEITLNDAPRWTYWLIALGYRLLRLTRDRVGVGLVARAYRVQDRRRRVFRLPATRDTVNELRAWTRQRR